MLIKSATISKSFPGVSLLDNASNRVQQQLKKPSDGAGGKKSSNQDSDADETSSGGIGGSNASSAVNKDEDDIYEFKSTPKDSSSSSSDEKESNSDKNEKSSGDKGGASGDADANQNASGAPSGAGSGANSSSLSKRPFSEVNDNADDSAGASNDDDNKRKKRKDSDTTNKEATKSATGGNRGSAPRPDKSGKSSGPPSKNLGLSGKSALDRKSPCASPKPASNASSSTSTNKASSSNAANDSDAEGDDTGSKGNDSNFNTGGGPKVPPLKIVIPQQSSGGDTETGGSSRNGKNASARSHPALPYVVASSNSNDSSADKESTSSRSASPSDSKSSDEKTTSKSSDERAQSRVLRSHRGGNASEGGSGRSKDNQGDRSVDRSNNSSPQMQQSSAAPSPASTSGDVTGTGGNGGNGGTSKDKDRSTASPAGSNQKDNEPETGSSSGTNPKSPPTSSSSATTAASNASSSNNTTNNAGTSSTQNNQSNSAPSTSTPSETAVHPRKRKIKTSKDQSMTAAASSSAPSTSSSASTSNEEKKEIKEELPDIHPHDQPITNCYKMFLNIRRQIERRQQNLFPVKPKPPQGFKDYLLNRRTYALAGKTPAEANIQFPANLPPQMKDMFTTQETERHKLKMKHIVDKEKLVLSVEQEILRVHGRAARALANQSVPFSVCTILKDAEVYNIITPEQEEKDRNARSRYNGRLFLGWLQDVDDKWEKIKEETLLRHHNQAESLHAVQKMDWEWKMKENSLCEFKAKPVIEESHVPIVNVSDDFDLLPA
nr:ankyrin repeat domain-containing protein 12-like isoform X3 [Aedes albopictus]